MARLLGEKLKKRTLGDLRKVDRKSGSTDDKLEYARRKLAALTHAKGQLDPDALAKEMQRLLAMLATMQQQVQSISDVNQSVIRKLAG